MRPAMTPISAELTGEECRGQLQPCRHRIDPQVNVIRQEFVRCDAEIIERKTQYGRRQHAVDKEIDKVRRQRLAQHLLFMHPPKPFRRYEQDHEQNQPDEQPQHAQKRGRQMLLQVMQRVHDHPEMA